MSPILDSLARYILVVKSIPTSSDVAIWYAGTLLSPLYFAVFRLRLIMVTAFTGPCHLCYAL